jgi:sulfur relay (sulfurtransferase) DsrC/TusE family protein
MVKQLMILCSDSIGDVVTKAVEKYIQKDGYVRITSGYGVKCKVPVQGAYMAKCVPWEAEVFIMALEDEQVQSIVSELKQYTKNCDTSPCLRMIITAVEEVI